MKNIWEDREFLRPRIPTTKKQIVNAKFMKFWATLGLTLLEQTFKKAFSKYFTFRKNSQFRTPRPFLRYQVLRGGGNLSQLCGKRKKKSLAQNSAHTRVDCPQHKTANSSFFLPSYTTLESVACLGKQRRCLHDHGPPDLATSIHVLFQKPTPTSSSSLRCTIFGREATFQQAIQAPPPKE